MKKSVNVSATFALLIWIAIIDCSSFFPITEAFQSRNLVRIRRTTATKFPTIQTTTTRSSPSSSSSSPSSVLSRLHSTNPNLSALMGYESVCSNSYFVTRSVFLRALAFVYGVAFLIAKRQNKALIGDNGITPARNILNRAQERGEFRRQRRSTWLDSMSTSSSTSSSSISSTTPVTTTTSTKGNITTKKEPSIVRWKNNIRKKIHTIGMEVNNNDKYQYWRERLWDRQDSSGRPVTTLLWLAKDRNSINPWLDGIAVIGFILSCFVFTFGVANVPTMFALWLCQRSLMAVGGPWYGYGWEPQLAELGFHAMFLVPFSWNIFNLMNASWTVPCPFVVVYAIRWYLFRIMIGAGLIKLRGDSKWKWPQLSVMNYFYETQPVPNPLSRYFHWTANWWHKGEVLLNHFVELIAPWLLLSIVPWPRPRRIGAIIQLAFQGILITSGNLSFLNWLTAVPAIMCLDDAFILSKCRFLFSSSVRSSAIQSATQHYPTRLFGYGNIQPIISFLFGILIIKLSIPVVQNLLSKRQIMNGSFDPLRLVNTYGAFGSVQEEREEFIISASSSYEGPWKEYQFQVKPGDVHRRPKFISPYHHRLDWQIWIASCIGSIDRSPWMYPFLLKLLQQDKDVLQLLDSNPFEKKDGEDENQPKYIRVDRYRYKFYKRNKDDEMTTTDSSDDDDNDDDDNVATNEKKEPYWTREYIGRVFPRQGVASIETLQEYVNANGY